MNNIFYNKIFFGPPGTGKSFQVKALTENKIIKSHIFRVTFYEDYSYYDFVGQYKPIIIKDFERFISESRDLNGERKPMPIISYDFIPGILIKSYIQALQTPQETVYLIIEEINRGNCSAIFGDIFQLLDRDENGSKYPIEKSKELYDFLKNHKINDISATLSLPHNLKIIATMNTSDQSLFPIDSAFKRRWQQEYCKIDYNCSNLKNVKIAGTNVLWLNFIKKVNEKIINLLSNEDKQIGHWFVQPYNDQITEEDFKNKVIAYLFYDVFKYDRNIFKDNSFSRIITKPIKELVDGIME